MGMPKRDVGTESPSTMPKRVVGTSPQHHRFSIKKVEHKNPVPPPCSSRRRIFDNVKKAMLSTSRRRRFFHLPPLTPKAATPPRNGDLDVLKKLGQAAPLTRVPRSDSPCAHHSGSLMRARRRRHSPPPLAPFSESLTVTRRRRMLAKYGEGADAKSPGSARRRTRRGKGREPDLCGEDSEGPSTKTPPVLGSATTRRRIFGNPPGGKIDSTPLGPVGDILSKCR